MESSRCSQARELVFVPGGEERVLWGRVGRGFLVKVGFGDSLKDGSAGPALLGRRG